MRKISDLISSWNEGCSGLDPNLVCYSFYYFPSHLQHLMSLSMMDGFLGLNLEFKKHFLNHINEICMNILWDFQNPTPIFVQFDGPSNYWIGFSVAKEKFAEDPRRSGYWNLSLQEDIYWCEVFGNREFKLHKNPIKEINNGVMARVVWSDAGENETPVESSAEDIANFIFKKSDVISVSDLQSNLTTFNSPEFKLEYQDITREKFLEWYSQLEDTEKRKLSIEIVAKRINDPTDLDQSFVFRLNTENQKLRTKHLETLAENLNLTTKLKLMEQGKFTKEDEIIKLERKVNVLEDDKSYLESRIASLIEKNKKEIKQLSGAGDLEKQISKNKKLQEKYENLLQQIYSLESQIFNLNVERSHLKGLIVLGVKTDNESAFSQLHDVAGAATGEISVQPTKVEEEIKKPFVQVGEQVKISTPQKTKTQTELNEAYEDILSKAENSNKKVA